MNSVKFALKQTTPALFSYIFVGLAGGMMLASAGYSPLVSFLSALFIYAGSMQVVMITLLTSGAPLLTVAVTALFIQFRHVFYGIGFVDEFRRIGRQKGSRWKYPYMALTVTDETYSILCALDCPEETDRGKVQFYILFFCHMIWVASCTVGAFIGGILPFSLAGIEFSATALFLSVVVRQWQTCRSHLPAVVGCASAAVCLLLFGSADFLMPTLCLSAAAVALLERPIVKKERAQNE